ncbi:histidine-type phosphatase [Roseateles cellulosilyticus]|uniref:Histidine-type phosphatase n=1 Tax=Pelomonas cellulosilytica TaxID=2906762 RepID=A0ABS8XKW5_9BURK|nr:histidine-type phosphatase [Pelomonas sp. P8]MCE4553459.1 histidine-type phosphatase [Pelomonas sp. P8]
MNSPRAWVSALCIAGLGLASPAWSAGQSPLQLERVVMLWRHGLRAPLPTEAAAEPRAGEAWPSWSTPASLLTPHGRAALALSGQYQRTMLQAADLLPAQGCPAPGQVFVWANTVDRTVASGEVLAGALTPGCATPVQHLPMDQTDPLFNPIEAGAVDFDAAEAVRVIDRETGGVQALVAPEGEAVRAMQRVLGCDDRRPEARCTLQTGEAALRPGADGRGLAMRGPIDVASGTAQVLALQYAEGLPMTEVGWGRARMTEIASVSRLHALLFEVYARPSYMAQRIAGPLSARLLQLLLSADAPAVSLLIGHDNNIAALTALLGVGFQFPGYGRNDPPVGSVLLLERLRDPASGRRYLRVRYEAQSLDQLRELAPLTQRSPPLTLTLPLPGCHATGQGLCELDAAAAWWRRRLYGRW